MHKCTCVGTLKRVRKCICVLTFVCVGCAYLQDHTGDVTQKDLTSFYVLHTLQRAFGWAAFRKVFKKNSDTAGQGHAMGGIDAVPHSNVNRCAKNCCMQ